MKSVFRILEVAVLVVSLFLLPAYAFADIVTIEASGSIDFVSQPDLNPLLGKEMTFAVTYSTLSSEDSSSAFDPNYGLYLDAIISYSATLDGISMVHPSNINHVFVSNDYGSPFYDNVTFTGYQQPSDTLNIDLSAYGLGVFTKASSNLVLRDIDQLFLSDDSIPSSFDLAQMEWAAISVNLLPQWNDINTRLDASITSFTVTTSAVPEPSTLLLLGSGLAGLGLMRRRLKK